MRYQKEAAFGYRWQQAALNRIGKKLGVVVFRPNYHAKKGDHNTVLFYMPEDHEYNQELEKRSFCSPMADELRPYFFFFENTDCNGNETFDFANHGSIDLRSISEDVLEGAISLAYWKRRSKEYVKAHGGYGGLYESDEEHNNMNRRIIEAFALLHKDTYLGSFNAGDDLREKLSSSDAPAFIPYTGQRIYNAYCDFIIPHQDKELWDLVKCWNLKHKGDPECMIDRVTEIGGEYFVWF